MELIHIERSHYSVILNYISKKHLRRYQNKGIYYFLSILKIYHSDFYLLKTNQNIVGCICIRFKRSRTLKNEAWFYDVLIFPKYRGRGYAKQLLRLAISIVRNKKYIQLYVQKNNKTAINLYKGIGFFDVAEKNDMILMRYEI